MKPSYSVGCGRAWNEARKEGMRGNERRYKVSREEFGVEVEKCRFTHRAVILLFRSKGVG